MNEKKKKEQMEHIEKNQKSGKIYSQLQSYSNVIAYCSV